MIPDHQEPEQVMWQGRFITAKKRGRWEYVGRARGIRAAVILAVDALSHTTPGSGIMRGTTLAPDFAEIGLLDHITLRFDAGPPTSRKGAPPIFPGVVR